MHVAITGSHGFIGREVARHFHRLGHRVSGLDLRADDGTGFDRAVSGSILQRRDLEATFENVDTVIHTAAIVEESGDAETFYRLNVDGAALAAQVARDSGVRRFIHLSSVMVYGFDFPDQVGESMPLWPNGNPYCDSKIASEDAVSALETDTFRVIIARPGDVVGPGSVPWVVRPVDLMRRKLFALPEGGRGRFNPIHVRDIARALLHLSELDDPARAYNLVTGNSVSCADYFDNLAKAHQLPRPLRLPSNVMRSAARLATKIAPILNFKAPFQAEGVEFLLRSGTYSGNALRASGFECQETLESLFSELRNLSR